MKLSNLTTKQREHLDSICDMKRRAEAGRRGGNLGDYRVTVSPHILKEIVTGKRCTPFDSGLERFVLDETI